MTDTITTVAFGVPGVPAIRTGRPGLRAQLGLATDDEVVLWNGGIWQWLDAPSAIRAVGKLVERRPRVKLVFMGAASHGPARAASVAAQALAQELGLLNQHVFFNQEWVPYEQRADWLLDADCAISTHVEHLETRFAFRTRILDCFWSGLPIVCTRGDELAERVNRDDLGGTAPQRDVEALAAAVEAVLERGRGAYQHQLAVAARDFAWPTVAEPLVQWVTASERPPRFGNGTGGRLSRRPFARARNSGYRLARSTLNQIGLRDWPSL